MEALYDLLPTDGWQCDREALREPLGPWLERARAAEPDIDAPLSAVARFVARKIRDADDPAAALANLDAGEAWLACACGAGDATAADRVERRYIAGALASLRPMRLDKATLDDVVQMVRRKLLLPGPDGATRLEEYAGQGRLAAFVRVVAVRTALDYLRAEKRRPDQAAREDPADVLMADGLSPELEVIRRRHTQAFKSAFQAAVEGLSAKDRGVLRMHLIDRLNIDDIAALHGVHRSSAARWLKDIRAELGRGTRMKLRAELRLSTEELESLYRAIDSQLDLSFARILGE